MDSSLRGHPLCSLLSLPQRGRIAALLKSGVRSRNCIFISLTSGSVFGFSSPAAAVARLTSEQLNLGQPLTSWRWWPSPVLEGGVRQADGVLVAGSGEGVLLPLPVEAGIPLSEAQSSLEAPDICSSRPFWNSYDFYNDEIDWDSTSPLSAKSQ